MPGRWTVRTGGTLRGALLALIGIAGCLAAAAYAAAWQTSASSGSSAARQPAGRATADGAPVPAARRAARPPRPSITRHPARTTTSTGAEFGFDDRQGKVLFQCRLDAEGWRLCRSPALFRHLEVGAHDFSVRALSRLGARSRAARFRWALVEPRSFAIAPQLSGLSPLYPGAPPVPLPMVLTNPNPAPIFVTSLRVSVSADPAGCDSAANLDLIESNASGAVPIAIPARGSVSLPAPGASSPAIRLRDLPVNQDACKGARFPLEFSGSAHG